MTETPKSDLAACAEAAVAREIAEQGIASAPPPDPELMDRLERAMLALPRTTRKVFLAHRLDGYTYRQIADITGLSERRIKRHMVKALLQLQRYAEGDERTVWQRWRQARLPCWFR